MVFYKLVAHVHSIDKNTLWDELMDRCAVPMLRSKFVDLKAFRNDVMHAHNMDTKAYLTAKRLIKNINEQLDLEIGKIIVQKETKNNKCDHAAGDFNILMRNAMKTMDEQKASATLMEQLSQIQSSAALVDASGMRTALKESKALSSISDLHSISKYISSPEFTAIQQQFKEISKIQANISPALIELQKTIAAIKPNPQIIEAAQKINDILKPLHLDDNLRNEND